MSAPPIGTPVNVLTETFGYPMRVSGAIVATQEFWMEGAENDMPILLDADRAHVLVTAISQGTPVSLLIPNALPGSGVDQYTVVTDPVVGDPPTLASRMLQSPLPFEVNSHEQQKFLGVRYPRGVCSGCGGNYGLNSDNTIRRHKRDQRTCPGGGKKSLGL